MGVDAVNSSQLIQFDSLDAALAGGDMEAVLLAFGISRAEGAEKAVKQKITEMKGNQAKIAELNELKTILIGAKDENGATITKDPEQIKKLVKFYNDNPEFADSTHKGINFYKSDGSNVWEGSADASQITEIKVEHGDGKNLETIKTSLQNKIDKLTSNDQLDMVELQSMVSKQNNAIEMVSTIAKKFADLKDSIVRRF